MEPLAEHRKWCEELCGIGARAGVDDAHAFSQAPDCQRRLLDHQAVPQDGAQAEAEHLAAALASGLLDDRAYRRLVDILTVAGRLGHCTPKERHA
jgi:hypothetical protein